MISGPHAPSPLDLVQLDLDPSPPPLFRCSRPITPSERIGCRLCLRQRASMSLEQPFIEAKAEEADASVIASGCGNRAATAR